MGKNRGAWAGVARKFADRLRKLREFCRTASPHAVPLALHTLVSTGMSHASHVTRNAAMEAKSAPRPAVLVMALFSFAALASALVLAFRLANPDRLAASELHPLIF